MRAIGEMFFDEFKWNPTNLFQDFIREPSLFCTDEEVHELDSGYSDDCSEENSRSTPRSSAAAVGTVGVIYVFVGAADAVNVNVSEPESTGEQESPVRRLIKWSLPPPIVPPQHLPGWHPMQYGLERFWQSAFGWFFLRFLKSDGHLWTFQPTTKGPAPTDWQWHVTAYSAKVRFQCRKKHGWTSMRGRVVFYYRMRREDQRIVCESLFRLFGQRCGRCHKSEQEFLTPLWYFEEIEAAVSFLSNLVAEKYYGGTKVPAPRRLRHGAPLHQHDPWLCQACHEGICVNNN